MRQVEGQEPSVRDYKNYAPIENAAVKLQSWASQGAAIAYLSALTEDKSERGDEIVGLEGLEADRAVLERYGFPSGPIYHRDLGERYEDVVERIDPLPDTLVEDDCESIGGANEMVYLRLTPETRKKVHSIVVKEFEGIDHLPDSLDKLV